MKALFNEDNLLSTKKYEIKEHFKVKKFVFSEDPIPEEFIFEDMSDFVREIPLKGYPNKKFVKETLVPEFEKAYDELTPVILELNEIIQKVKEIVKEGSKSLPKYTLKDGLNYLNAEPYQKFHVILPIFIQLRTSLNAIRLSILNSRVAKLVALQKLCKYLAYNPRYVHINIEKATQNWKALEFYYIPDVFSKYIAYKNQIDDIKCMLSFIPRPFSDDDANKNLFLRLIKCHLKMRDPITGYIPYVDEFETLALFLDSNASPFSLSRIKSLNCHQFQTTLALMHESLAKWCDIEPNQRNINEVIKSVVARMLFDKYRLDLRPIGLASAALQKHINELSQMPLSKIGITKEQVPEEFLEKKPSELFSELPDVKIVPENLMLCLFCTNPIDAAFLIYKSGLALAGMLASVHNERVEKSQRFDDLFAVWKIALVAAEIPEPDQLFQWMSMYKNIEVMPPLFTESLRIPKTVIKTMLTESLVQNTD